MRSFDVLDPNVPIDRSLVIEASAGTGKTFSIQHLFVRSLLRGVKVNEILVVTFTKASTKELKNRILEQLRSIKSGCYPPYLDRGIKEIEQALRDFGLCEIDTIHAFSKRMLSTYAFEAQLFVDQVHDESPLDEEKMKALADFLLTDLEGLSYSLAQKKSLMSLDPSSFVMSEKATTPFVPFQELFTHFEKLVDKLPKQGLKEALIEIKDQFYKKAEIEEIELFGEVLEKAIESPSLETFDELLFCGEAVLDHFSRRKKKGVDPDFLKIIQEELTPLIKYAISKDILKKRFLFDMKPLIDERTFMSGRFGFDDILTSMKTAVSVKEFKERVQGRYKVVLIDEFQDTDPTQWEIFSTLFVNDWGGVLYLVGDPKQSIYSFRDADIYTYLRACEQIGDQVCLLTNYRSHKNLIEPLNSFFDMEKFIPLPKINSFLPYRKVLAGREPCDDLGDRMEFFFAQSEEEALLDLTAAVQKRGIKGCCVLVKDKNQGKKVSEVFQEYDVPHFFLKRDDWEEHPDIFQLKFFIKALEHPEDLHRIKALLTTKLCGLQSCDLMEAPYPELIEKLKVLSEMYAKQGLFAAFNRFIQTPFPQEPPLIRGRGELKVLFKLIEMASKKEDPELFLERLYLGIEKDEGEFNPKELNCEGVAISTMHMSKGLEFDHVFAFGISAKIKIKEEIEAHPEGMSIKDVLRHRVNPLKVAETESEWIRQLYVSLTRAKETLYIPIYEKNSILALYLQRRFTDFEAWLAHEPFVSSRKNGLRPSQDLACSKSCLNNMVQRIKKPPPLTFQKKSHFIHSYTTLASGLKEKVFDTCQPLLPKGKEVGILIHSLLEKIPYLTLKTEQRVIDWIKEQLNEEFVWIPYLGRLFFNLFRQRLPMNFCLLDVPQEAMLRELDFLFATEPEFTHDDEEYVTGQIDALFKYREKYYLIDWKTHALPSYKESDLIQFMSQSPYPLQAKIYQKALRLTVEKIEQRPFEEVFGGFLYVFLRGIDQGLGMIVWK